MMHGQTKIKFIIYLIFFLELRHFTLV